MSTTKKPGKYELALTADFDILAADGGEAASNPTFTIEAYSGDAIRQWWSDQPLVIDLAGMVAPDSVPILYAHDSYSLDSILGQSQKAEKSNTLRMSGELFGDGDTYEKVVRLAKKGLKFQASIGATTSKSERIAAGETVTVNGRQFAGPITVIRASKLREVSIVLFGADANTSAAIAAEANEGLDMADNANKTPEDVVKASEEATAKGAVGHPLVNAKGTDGGSATDGTVGADVLASMREQVKAEILADLKAESLKATRDERPKAPAAHVVDAAVASSPEVIEASLCMVGNLPGIEARFDAKVLEAADRRRNRTSLQEVLIEAARANGYTGHYRVTDGNCREVLASAFSTHSISNVLGATYGKFLRAGFMGVERDYEKIASVRTVSDYKTMTGIRLNGGFEFQDVGPTGELKSAAASDETRTIAAKLTGRLSSVSMVDIINDDLGALADVPKRLGRGAALKLNTDFWTAFVAGGYGAATPGGGNALSLTSLKAVVAAWRKLTDTDGNPLAIPAKYLLVPPELEITAAELMTSSLLITGNTTPSGNKNVLAGRYEVVASSYLTSATTWWLVADPMDLPAMEIAYLGGRREPTVESADVDFAQLGIQFRGHFSYGVAVAETKGAYKMATA